MLESSYERDPKRNEVRLGGFPFCDFLEDEARTQIRTDFGEVKL